MDDMEGQVRELLRRQAQDVPPQLAVPPTLAGRAHRRFAMNAFGAAVVLVVLAAGAFAALRPGDRALVHQPGASENSPVAIAPCTAADLAATSSMSGAMGSREGEILLGNASDSACTLEGTPENLLFDESGAPIDGIQFQSTQPGWQVDGTGEPNGWPVVTLAPGERASVRIRWSNWCGGIVGTWGMPIGKGGIVTVQRIALDPPPCNGPDEPSTIEVGPFEPSSG